MINLVLLTETRKSVIENRFHCSGQGPTSYFVVMHAHSAKSNVCKTMILIFHAVGFATGSLYRSPRGFLKAGYAGGVGAGCATLLLIGRQFVRGL